MYETSEVIGHIDSIPTTSNSKVTALAKHLIAQPPCQLS